MSYPILVHSVPQAHQLLDEVELDRPLFASRAVTAAFLKQNGFLNVTCISSFISDEEVILAEKQAREIGKTLLEKMDLLFAPELNAHTHWGIDYFNPLYRYFGKQFFGYLSLFLVGIKKCGLLESATEVQTLPEPEFTNGLEPLITLNEVLSASFPHIKWVSYPESTTSSSRTKPSFLFRVKHEIKKVFTCFASKLYLFHKNKLIVLGNLYEFEAWPFSSSCFGKILLNKESLSKIPPASLSPKLKDTVSKIASYVFWNQYESEPERWLKQLILRNFESVFPLLYSQIEHLKMLIRKYDPEAAVWGHALGCTKEVLLAKYCMKNNVPVFGMQHGGYYGYTQEYLHQDSDYQSCNYFLTYGFGKKELQAALTEQTLTCDVVPVGKFKYPSGNALKEIQLVYPITSCMSLFGGSFQKLPSDTGFLALQLEILKYLDTWEKGTVHIKLPPATSESVVSLLEMQFKNIEVIRNISFMKYLEKYNPSAVLIDFPSTPLVEVTSLNTEVFLLGDKLHPFSPVAENMLMKRTHLASNLDSLIESLDAFKQGRLAKKRDPEFAETFANPTGSIKRLENILTRTINLPLQMKGELSYI